MGFFDKFGSGQGWLAKVLGGQQAQKYAPTEPVVNQTMDNALQTNQAFTQPQPQQQFTPNLGQQTTPPIQQNTMDTNQVNPGFSDVNVQFMNEQMDRLNIPQDQRQDFMNNMYKYSQTVRGIESDNNPMAAAGTTSAKGVYQFTDASVDTGFGRLGNMGYNQDFISGIPQSPHDWSDEQADAMFLGNMFAQSGSDKYIRGIGAGDVQSQRDAYSLFHHTNPDEATLNRMNKFMPLG